MRPLLALMITVGILSGLRWYMGTRQIVVQEAIQPIQLSGQPTYSLSLILSFRAEPDAFTAAAGGAHSVIVKLAGQTIFSTTDPVEPGQTLVVDPVSNIVVGKNEFWIEALSNDQLLSVARAARIRVLNHGHLVIEQTLWSEPGTPVQAIVMLDVPAPTSSRPTTETF